MNNRNILLEIGTEEIPARFMPAAIEDLRETARAVLKRSYLEIPSRDITVLGTPRRLVLHVAGVPEKQADRLKRHLGPPVAIAVDGHGGYTQAAAGFAKSRGVQVEDLQIFPDAKGDRLGYEESIQGRPMLELLPGILSEIIKGLSFPKSMRWGTLEFNFARPVHWLLALFGEDSVSLEIGGVKSGRHSRGHRFLAPRPFRVKEAELESFKSELRERFCILDQVEREALIREKITAAARESRPACSVREDEELLREVNFLVEYPVALCGSFADEYLNLPAEVLINVMRQHQKYFPVMDAEEKLAPAFVVVSNLPDDGEGLIRRGNERVIRARLADAKFFYDEDQKTLLSQRMEGLKDVVFQSQLGSYFDKKERVKALLLKCFPLSSAEGRARAELAADLCKADLLTEMVQEFPKLQGAMGEQYALLEGVGREVARAVREHYLPRFADDALPQSKLGQELSIADKTDTIVGCFGIGLIPTGSQDPYALRRQAVGIINLLLKRELNLKTIIDNSLSLLQSRLNRPAEDVACDVLEFFRQRLYHHLTGGGYRYDLVEAALGAGCDMPYLVELRCRALQEMAAHQNWKPLVIAFKRVARIIPPQKRLHALKYDLFREEAEKTLYRRFNLQKKHLQGLLADKDYRAVLEELAALRPVVDEFFDQVLVMCEEEEIRENRLSLLGAVSGLFSQVADFSKIVTQAA